MGYMKSRPKPHFHNPTPTPKTVQQFSYLVLRLLRKYFADQMHCEGIFSRWDALWGIFFLANNWHMRFFGGGSGRGGDHIYIYIVNMYIYTTQLSILWCIRTCSISVYIYIRIHPRQVHSSSRPQQPYKHPPSWDVFGKPRGQLDGFCSKLRSIYHISRFLGHLFFMLLLLAIVLKSLFQKLLAQAKPTIVLSLWTKPSLILSLTP